MDVGRQIATNGQIVALLEDGTTISLWLDYNEDFKLKIVDDDNKNSIIIDEEGMSILFDILSNRKKFRDMVESR